MPHRVTRHDATWRPAVWLSGSSNLHTAETGRWEDGMHLQPNTVQLPYISKLWAFSSLRGIDTPGPLARPTPLDPLQPVGVPCLPTLSPPFLPALMQPCRCRCRAPEPPDLQCEPRDRAAAGGGPSAQHHHHSPPFTQPSRPPSHGSNGVAACRQSERGYGTHCGIIAEAIRTRGSRPACL